MSLDSIFSELMETLLVLVLVTVFSLCETPLKKVFVWLHKEAGLLMFGLLWIWFAYLMLVYTMADPAAFRYKFSPFFADMFEFGWIIIFAGLFDFIVLWDYNTWHLICIERNESYAKIISAILIAGAILCNGTTL